MKDYDVILASGAEHLKARFESFGYRVYTCEQNYDERRIFPNADIYTRISNVAELSNRRVIVIQSCTGAGPAESERFTTADRVIELMLLLDLLNRPVEVEKVGHKQYQEEALPPPSKVEVVLTFQPFALQDKSFMTGEAVSGRWSMETIAKMCNKIWVVNPHATDHLPWVERLRERGLYEVIDIIPDLIKFAARQFGFEEYGVITPDEGAQLRYDIEGFGKSRTNSYCVEMHGEVDTDCKNIIVIDDLTKSGSTLLKASERLIEQGVENVGMAVAHVLPLIEIGEEKLESLVAKSHGRIVTSNTIRTNVFCEMNPTHTYNIVDTLINCL
ncbi:MAG: hypothetical protein BAJATHORv1_10079 [Candidatus Thorarchaeota archaeon]|nr:MAG: hypothetical protein BAJATHORv1_10079 [Candidatus Thorarchaeota archaeon]